MLLYPPPAKEYPPEAVFERPPVDVERVPDAVFDWPAPIKD